MNPKSSWTRAAVAALVAVCAVVIAPLLPASPASAIDASKFVSGAKPVWCGGGTLDGGVDANGVQDESFGLLYVPAGGTVNFKRFGSIHPTQWGAAGQAEYAIRVRLYDPSNGGVVYETFNGSSMTMEANFDPPPWPWVEIPLNVLFPDTWTNNTGASKIFLLSMYAHVTYAGDGLIWSIVPQVTGDLSGQPDCNTWIADGSEYNGVNPAARYQCPGQGEAGDPVNTRSGNLHMPLPGLTVPGRGPGLPFELGYNSSAAGTTGAAGRGWSTTLDMSIAEQTDGDMVVTQETGSTVRFWSNGSGGWNVAGRISASLVENPDGTFTYERKNFERFTFAANGRLQSIEDRYGNATTLTYPTSTSRQAQYMQDEGGRRLTFTWSGSRLSTVTDQLGSASGGPRQLGFAYTGSDLTQYTDERGGQWKIGYDGSGRMTTFRRPRHAATPSVNVEMSYDSSNRVVWQEDELNHRTTFAYDTPNDDDTRITYPDGRVRIDTYAEGGCRTKTVLAPGTNDETSTTYTYDPLTNAMLTATDGRGKTWTYGYDLAANRTSAEDPLGRISRWQYNALDQVTLHSRGELRTGTSTYDTSQRVTDTATYSANGLVQTVVEASGAAVAGTTTYTYGDSSHPEDVTSITDPRGKTWSTTYQAGTGYVLSQTDPLGQKTTFVPNEVGWVTETVSPKGNVTGGTPADFRTTFAYDKSGRSTMRTSPTGERVRWTYDANGNLATLATGTTAPATTGGDITTYTYNAADQPTGVDEPGAGSTTYEPDDAGRRERWTDETGAEWVYGYDDAGRLESETSPTSQVTTYDYDAAGALARVDAASDAAIYSYDDAGQLTTIDYDDGVTLDITAITHDRLGRRTAATVGGVTELWAWDARSRLTSHRDRNVDTTLYGWDATSNVTSIRYPGDSTSLIRAFDDAGQLDSVTDPAGRVTSFGQDANGNWTTTTFPTVTGNVDTRTYDRNDRMSGVTWNKGATVLGSIDYTPRDAKGYVTTAATTGAAGPNQTWGYDARGRLATEDGTAITHDAAGNLTERADGTLQVFDPAGELCWTSPTATSGTCATPASNATTYQNDDRGNRTELSEAGGPVTRYAYDFEDRMRSTTKTSAHPITGATGEPVAGDFDGDGNEDVFWYGPGAAADWISWGTSRGELGRPTTDFTVGGSSYQPFVGDFDGNGTDDIFWYIPGSGSDSIWFGFDRLRGTYTSKAFTVNGTYDPVPGDFDADGFDDVYWYGPGSAADSSWWGAADVDDPSTTFA